MNKDAHRGPVGNKSTQFDVTGQKNQTNLLK